MSSSSPTTCLCTCVAVTLLSVLLFMLHLTKVVQCTFKTCLFRFLRYARDVQKNRDSSLYSSMLTSVVFSLPLPLLIIRTDQSVMGGIRGGPVKMEKVLIKLMVLAGVIGLSYGAIQRPDYDDTPNPEFLNPSWLDSIPDDQPLSEVTMPGTHNTMALYGGVYAECQTWSLASQLRAGVRFLDVRVRHAKGNLTIHHWVVYQWAHFGHVLEGVTDFLQEYPSETVLMRVKEEFSDTNDIYGAVVDYIHRYANWDLLWHSRLVPTMGEARGKLIILQDFSGPDLGMRYGSLDIADNWKVYSLLQVEEKWQSVYEHLEAAPAGNKDQIFLTYSSGAGLFAYPRAVAQYVNQQLYNYLSAKTDLNQRLGIICMDFPAAPIIQMIIDFQGKESIKRKQAFDAIHSEASLKYTIYDIFSSLRKNIKHFTNV